MNSFRSESENSTKRRQLPLVICDWTTKLIPPRDHKSVWTQAFLSESATFAYKNEPELMANRRNLPVFHLFCFFILKQIIEKCKEIAWYVTIMYNTHLKFYYFRYTCRILLKTKMFNVTAENSIFYFFY